jgi:uncharacterized oligopeptide transporter (OPT) family protein
LVTPDRPFPSAVTWEAVAKLLTKGIRELHPWAAYAAIAGGVVGLSLEVIRLVKKGRFPISPIGLGLGFVIPWEQCFAMFLGAFVFWLAEVRWRDAPGWINRVIVQNQEPICAGIIAGGSLTGVGLAILENVVLK